MLYAWMITKLSIMIYYTCVLGSLIYVSDMQITCICQERNVNSFHLTWYAALIIHMVQEYSLILSQRSEKSLPLK